MASKSTSQKLVQSLLKSLGLKRKLANLFQTLATVTAAIPVLAPYALILQPIASWLGVAGVGHAVASKTFKLNIHSVGAFFSALLLATKSVPALEPYAGLIHTVAAILSALSVGTMFGTK